MHVVKCTALGAASGAVIGGISAISCMSLEVFTHVFAKSLANSIAGRPPGPYIFNEHIVPHGSVLKAVCIGIVLGGLVGLVSAVVMSFFFPSKKDSN